MLRCIDRRIERTERVSLNTLRVMHSVLLVLLSRELDLLLHITVVQLRNYRLPKQRGQLFQTLALRLLQTSQQKV